MSRSPHSSTEAQARYAAWDRQAPITCAVLLVVLGASFFFAVPGVAFAAGNLIPGVCAFFAWRATLANKMNAALALASLAIVATLLALAFALSQRIEPLIVQAFGIQALALFACILLARRGKPI